MQKRSNRLSILHKAPKLDQSLLSIEENLDHICHVYGLITAEQKLVLLKDVKYLLLDNIAQEVKLIFFDSVGNTTLLECMYTAAGLTETINVVEQNREKASGDIAIDALFKFTEAFLAMSEDSQKLILHNTDFEWYPE